MTTPNEAEGIAVCWSTFGPECSTPTHEQAENMKTLCGIQADLLWEFRFQDPGDSGVTCKRCLAVKRGR